MVEPADAAGAENTCTRHEHKELRAGLDHLHCAAHALAQTNTVDGARRVQPICGWLTGVLMPHVAWEGSVIFQEIDELASSTWPTRVVRFDHAQINRAASELSGELERLCRGESSADERREVYDDLIGLETLVRTHLERQEVFLLPIL